MKYLKILLIIVLAIAAGCQTSVDVRIGRKPLQAAAETRHAD